MTAAEDRAWIGALSPSWETRRLGSIGTFTKGFGGSREDDREAGVPVIRYGDLYTSFNTVITASRSFVDAEDASKYAALRRGTVVFAASGEDPEEIGKSAISLLEEPALVGGDTILFQPNADVVVPMFLQWVLESSALKSCKAIRSSGYTVVHISTGRLKTLPIPLPSLVEQQTIADFLDRETAEIDAFIADQERLIELLTERRVALVFKAVTKGLRSDDPVVTSGVDWLGDIPAHWGLARLKHSVASAVPGVWGADPTGDANDILCLRVADFDRPRLGVGPVTTVRSVPDKDRAGRLLEAGDLLLEKSGGTAANPVGFVAYLAGLDVPVVSSNFITRLRLVSGHVARYWLYAHAAAYSTRLTARSVNQTTGIQNLDQGAYFDELFPFPPPVEQHAIADSLDCETSIIDATINDTYRAIALSRERRAALITAAVTGQIDVTTGRARSVGAVCQAGTTKQEEVR